MFLPANIKIKHNNLEFQDKSALFQIEFSGFSAGQSSHFDSLLLLGPEVNTPVTPHNSRQQNPS